MKKWYNLVIILVGILLVAVNPESAFFPLLGVPLLGAFGFLLISFGIVNYTSWKPLTKVLVSAGITALIIFLIVLLYLWGLSRIF